MTTQVRRALSCAIALLALATATGGARAASLSIGGYGGASIPIAQDDNGKGSIFGGRLAVAVVPLLTFEPYYARTSGGSVTQDINGVSYQRDGLVVSAFGANALLTLGGPLSVYPFAGIGRHKVTRAGTPDHTLTGYNGGLGLGISPLPGLRVDLRAEANAIRQHGFGRTYANVTAGLSYRFFKAP